MTDYYTALYEEPQTDEGRALAEWIAKRIGFHENVAQECDCDQDGDGCWYRHTEKEQWGLRFDSLFYALTQEAADGFPNFITQPTDAK